MHAKVSQMYLVYWGPQLGTSFESLGIVITRYHLDSLTVKTILGSICVRILTYVPGCTVIEEVHAMKEYHLLPGCTLIWGVHDESNSIFCQDARLFRYARLLGTG